jgi:hypothetical protein
VCPGFTNENGKIPYRFINEKAPISAFISALKKRKGKRRLKVLGYIAFLEFHKNGNPHYHLIIHFADNAYRKHDLQKSWKHGFLHRREFSSRNEYLDMFPYLLKDPLRYPDQAYQIMPPQDWLDNYPKINRVLSSQNILLGGDRRNRKRSQKKGGKPTDENTRSPTEYHQGLKKCGQTTSFRAWSNGTSAWYSQMPIDYYEARKLPGQYNKFNAYEFDDPDRVYELLESLKRRPQLKALETSKRRAKKKCVYRPSIKEAYRRRMATSAVRRHDLGRLGIRRYRWHKAVRSSLKSQDAPNNLSRGMC